MKRMIVALAIAGVAATCGSARADWGGITPSPSGAHSLPSPGSISGPGTLMGLGAPANPARGPDQYGLAPWLRKTIRPRGGLCGPAAGCAPAPAVGGYGAAGFGPVQQGTLAFPHHPFVRSPRDFFMWGN